MIVNDIRHSMGEVPQMFKDLTEWKETQSSSVKDL
jgi:hypothetical protein